MGMMVKRFVDNNLIGNSKSIQSQWSELRGAYIEIVRNLESNIKTGVFGYKPFLYGEV